MSQMSCIELDYMLSRQSDEHSDSTIEFENLCELTGALEEVSLLWSTMSRATAIECLRSIFSAASLLYKQVVRRGIDAAERDRKDIHRKIRGLSNLKGQIAEVASYVEIASRRKIANWLSALVLDATCLLHMTVR